MNWLGCIVSVSLGNPTFHSRLVLQIQVKDFTVFVIMQLYIIIMKYYHEQL